MSHSSVVNMDWPNYDTEKLIDLFRDHTCLWNSNKSGFKINSQKHDAWENISKEMGRPTKEVKRKMNSLMASFRRERLKRIRSNNPLLPTTSDKIKTTWFGYKKMLFMIESDRYKFSEENAKILHDLKTEDDEQETLIEYEEFDESEQYEVVSPPEKKNPDLGRIRILNPISKSTTPKSETIIQNLVIESPSSHDSMIIADYIEDSNTYEEQLEEEEEQDISLAEEESQRKVAKVSKNPFMIKRRKIVEVPRIEHSYSIPKPSPPKAQRDGSEIFGEHVAYKLKSYNRHARNWAQHLINKVLFEADMGKFDNFGQNLSEASP